MRQYWTGTMLVCCSDLPDPCSKLSNKKKSEKKNPHARTHTKKGWSRDGNQLPSHGPSSQASWLDSNNQMVLLGLSLCYERWQWDGTTFFCLTASNHVFPQWQACAITSTPGGLQTSLYPANKIQLVGHTSCQTTHIVIGLKRSENLSNSIV